MTGSRPTWGLRRAQAVAVAALALFSTACEEDWIINVAISPGGRYVAYTAVKSGLTVFDVATSASRSLQLREPRPGGLAWAPDARRLVCVERRSESGGSWDLVLFENGFSQRRVVAEHPAKEFDPAFSADGATVYFCSTRNGDADLFALDVNSGAVSPLLAAPADQIAPRPSPQGGQLAYISFETGRPSVRLIELDSKQVRVLALDPPDAAGPVVDVRWDPEAGDSLIVSCRTPRSLTAYRYDLERDRARRLMAFASDDDIARNAGILPMGFNTFAWLRDGLAWARPNVWGAKAERLTRELPDRCTSLVVDPASHTYAAVFGDQFLAVGTLAEKTSRLWLPDAATALKWARFLADNGLRTAAIREYESLAPRLKEPADRFASDEQRACLLRETGRSLEAWTVAEAILGNRERAPEARAARGRAARLMAEIALFDHDDPTQAAALFKAASDALTTGTSDRYACNPQTLINELDRKGLAEYVKAVNAWRRGDWGAGVRRFEKLLKTHPESKPLQTEVLSLFLDPPDAAFLRLKAPGEDMDLLKRSARLKHKARAAQAYVDTPGVDVKDALPWLCVARLTLGDERAARDLARRLLEQGLNDETERGAVDLLSEYAYDTGAQWFREWNGEEERRVAALLHGLVEDVLMSPRVKPDLALCLAGSTQTLTQVLPELAQLRAGLRAGAAGVVARQQRFAMARLQETPERGQDAGWLEMAALASGLTAESQMRQGNWLDARQSIEQTLGYLDAAGPSAAQGKAAGYRQWLTERRALIFQGAESSTWFTELMAIESGALDACFSDPAGVSPAIWMRALRGYVKFLNQNELRALRPVALWLMADAYGALSYPPELKVFALRAALAADPKPEMAEALRERLARELDAAGDPWMARAYRGPASGQ